MRAATPLVVAAVFLLPAGPARPCSALMPHLGAVAPADDATGVPTNALLHVAMNEGRVTFAATRAGGDSVDAPLPVAPDDDVAVVDLGDLAPATPYTITFDPGDDGVGRAPLSFTTGDGPDEATPTITSETTATVRHQQGSLPFLGSMCGPVPTTNVVTIGPLAADDDVLVAGWRLLRLDERGGRAQVAVALGPHVDEIVTREPDPGTYRYGVVAFDLAGNESEMVEVDAWVSGVGCSATRARSTSAPASAGLVAVLVVAARRRVSRSTAGRRP